MFDSLMRLYKKNIDLVKFLIVAVVTNILFVAVYEGTILAFSITESYLFIPYGLAFVISSFAAYLCNRFWVFRGKHRGGTAVKFYVIYGSTFAFQMGMIYFVTHVLGWSKFIAPFPGLCITMPTNFLLNRFWTFKKVR